MSATWIVQENLGSTSNTANLLKTACIEEGQDYLPINVMPFSFQLPDLPVLSKPFIFYGRLSVILGAYNDLQWRPGVFFNPDAFQPVKYLENWKELMLNHDMELLCVRDIPKYNLKDSEKYFLRPNDDFKFFTGGIFSKDDIDVIFANSTDNINEPINYNTMLSIASVKEIIGEWRLFFVDGCVVSGSQYQPNVSAFIPPEVIEFAQSAAKQWQPNSIFVMDIASTTSGLKIIECNCFNGSGFYASNLNYIVRAVSAFV